MPELANTSSSPRVYSAASSETRFSGVSSTSKILTFFAASEGTASGREAKLATVMFSKIVSGVHHEFAAARQPHAHHREQLVQVHRLGNVIRCARFDTFL